ncbi:mannose/cellobiose epimerase-like protein (N-acyl-D-glucosamine 2-epimerase family)/sugar/nucleoside kinase (ribokinase family) [Janthinobacterium sp. CG_S6]|nr:mannose/cellobiose epimerase-like protein (N-acyl-D-glucosamine 2-epimerase family)/sugar/nucleoside kinase (ribokinase family) [Janthinobacterium sp. CG_S6]
MNPDFRSRGMLLGHIKHTMQFYHPRCVDPSGGFYHFFMDDGGIYDHATRHLVSSTRFVFNYAMAYRQFGDADYLAAVRHGVAFLRDAHRNPDSGGYAWQLTWTHGKAAVVDGDNHCYGLAFVLLAYAHAVMAGVDEARAHLDETFELMERRFWQPEHGLYADQASADWSTLDPYRGQNANMHACEALLAAFEASGDARYLHRAETLAYNITVRQAALAGGMIWEHYKPDWSIDWEYNLHDKSNIFRPWGYQPGHFTEWAKLLLVMERHAGALAGSSDWLAPRAAALFDAALANAWDGERGGIFYGFGPDGEICDGDKYFWVQAESLAAAAVLAARSGEARYWDCYDKIWDYSWRHFVDHQHGAWYRILSADNAKLGAEKSPAGKVDYHTMGACYEVLNVIDAARALPRFVSAGEALTDMLRSGADSWSAQVGGSTWNVARVMARLGVPSAFAGAVSRDVFGDALAAANTAAGLDPRFMQQLDKSPLLAIVHHLSPPQYFFVGDDSADLHFDAALLPQGWQGKAQWVHFGGISLARQPLAGKLLALAAELKAAGVKISYDPNFRVLMDEHYDATLRRMTELADVIKVSDEDLEGLFRSADIDAAFATLRGWNPHATYLYTKGARGAALYRDGAVWQAAPPKIDVVDSVGAGDASIGGLLYSLMYRPRHDGGEHLRFAVAAGAGACLAAGATPPDVALVERLFAASSLS